jgi:hypothetical protein
MSYLRALLSSAPALPLTTFMTMKGTATIIGRSIAVCDDFTATVFPP